MKEQEKKLAAEEAALMVQDGMTVGLGTGSTVAYLLPAIARRRLDLRCAATSPATERKARELGLRVQALDEIAPLDITIDGADQVGRARWLVKGGGGAHTREKIAAHAAKRFVVIVSSDKLVAELMPPIPLELLRFGLKTTLEHLGSAAVRDVAPSPDGGVIADYLGPVGAPAELAAWLAAMPGVVDHGLFEPDLADEILVGCGNGVKHLC